MRNYNKTELKFQDTLIKIAFFSDISSELGNIVPYPNHLIITKEKIIYSWLIDGYFDTRDGIDYLNDILARFKITFQDCQYIKRLTVEKSNKKAYKLKHFQGLKSKAKAILTEKYQRMETKADDYVFWCIKLYSEDLIRQDGLIIYDDLERWAFSNFIDHAKDRSTLRAKCRSVYNWYFDRDWKIGRIKKYENMQDYQEKTMATRQQHITKINKKLAEDTKRKVLNVVTGMFAHEYRKANGKWNISKIAKDSGTTRPTVMKYLPKETLF